MKTNYLYKNRNIMAKKESTYYNRQIQKAGSFVKRPNEVIKRPYEDGNMKLTFKSPDFYDRDLAVTDKALLSQAQKESSTMEIDVTTSATTIDLSLADTIILNMTTGSTITEISNFVNGKTYKVFVVQDETGGYSLDIDASLDYVTVFGDLSVDTTANSVTILEFVCGNDKVYVESDNEYNYIENYIPFKFTIDTTLGSNAGPTFQLPLKDIGFDSGQYIKDGEPSDETPYYVELNYDFIVDWGDGTSDHITAWDDTAKNHTYLTDNQYQISITGLCEGFGTYSNWWDYDTITNDYEKIISVEDLGYTGIRDCMTMFEDCLNLMEVNITTNKTLKNTYTIYDMFYGCSSLTSIDVSNLDIYNVSDINGIFGSCSSLINIDLSTWDVSNVIDMNYIFYGCSSLTSIVLLTNWDVSNVIRMEGMFRSCSSLTTIDLSNWDVSNVTNMSNMFYNVPLDTQSYDALLIGWGSLSPDLNDNLIFDANLAQYTPGGAAEAGRTLLTDPVIDGGHAWSITDAGPVV